MAKQYAALEQALGYEFKKDELIIEALTHRSHHHELGDSRHNERLEFLGDAVLDLCITEMIMELSPETNEGVLSKLRSQLVSESSLARAASKLGLGAFMRLGRGEDLSGGRSRDSLLADTFEAVLAAVYLDGGLEAVIKIVEKSFDARSDKLNGVWEQTTQGLLILDYKSRLQELCQSAGMGAPTYQCTEVNGPDHMRRFTMALTIQGKEILSADGSTKKEATQKAARTVLETYPDEDLLHVWLASFGIKSRTRIKTQATPATDFATLTQKTESSDYKAAMSQDASANNSAAPQNNAANNFTESKEIPV